jgi:GR25 family glycosyltransferase involved in LPS biosynthesis
MEGYIIYLPGYANSVRWAQNALDSAKKYNWNVQLYPGVDGTKMKIQDFGLTVYSSSKKANRLFEKSGVHGCFLSHYHLWKKAIQENKTIAVFEHDAMFLKEFADVQFVDVIKLYGFKKAKPNFIGNWWESTCGYIISPPGAYKLLDWVKVNGAIPSDWMLSDGIVDVVLDNNNFISKQDTDYSFTKDFK